MADEAIQAVTPLPWKSGRLHASQPGLLIVLAQQLICMVQVDPMSNPHIEPTATLQVQDAVSSPVALVFCPSQ